MITSTDAEEAFDKILYVFIIKIRIRELQQKTTANIIPNGKIPENFPLK